MAEIKGDKTWRLHASDGVEISLRPIFVVNQMQPGQVNIATNKDVECTMVKVEMRKNGVEPLIMDVGFQELFMFVYFCANEELRQALQLRMERNITEIPYEVTFKLDKGEIDSGMAKRLIKLPVDDITMATVRADAQFAAGKANLDKVNDWFKKRTDARKRSVKLLEKK